MKTRIALHLAVLASAAAIFTATAIAKFSSDADDDTAAISLPKP